MKYALDYGRVFACPNIPQIRNPLSAVMHCADSIAHSLSEVRLLLNQCEKRSAPDNDSSRTADDLRNLNSSIGDAVDTIMACTMHQKRIIDDILSTADLETISAKRIRNALQQRVDYDLSGQKVSGNGKTIASICLHHQGCHQRTHHGAL